MRARERERERERETERQRDRETERQRETETETETDRDRAFYVQDFALYKYLLLIISQVLLYSIQRKTWVPHMNYKQRNSIYMYERFTVYP